MNLREIKERLIARSKNSLANFVDLKRKSFRIIDWYEIQNYLENHNLFHELLEQKQIILDFSRAKLIKHNDYILSDYQKDKLYEKDENLSIADDVKKYIAMRRDELFNKLLKLVRLNDESIRETGISHLKIGFPFVSGSYYDESNKLDYYRAPLFFFNVSVKRTGEKFVLTWDEVIYPNINLLNRLSYFLKVDLNKEIEELERDYSDIKSAFSIFSIKYDLMIHLFQEKLKINIEKINFSEEFELVKFPFKSETLTDLKRKEEKVVDTLCFSALIGFYKYESAELIHDIDNWNDSEEYFNELEGKLGIKDSEDDNYDPIPKIGDVVQISDLDFSQKVAISSALQKDLVINGPPGTGKSQTIVNLLINILNSGKKALFCAEKRVATEVVYDRLHQFKHFALLVHDLKSDKKSFKDHLRRSYDLLKRWSAMTIKSSTDVVNRMNTLLNNISKFHNFLSTSNAQLFIEDLEKYGGKISSEILDKIKKYHIFSNLTLTNFDEQYENVKRYLELNQFYSDVLAKSKTINDFDSFRLVVEFSWGLVEDRESTIIQYFLTNKLKYKVSFWNKRKVKKFKENPSNDLGTEFQIFSEIINKSKLLRQHWVNKYSLEFYKEVNSVSDVLKSNQIDLYVLMKCLCLDKYDSKYSAIFDLENINWKSEYKKLVKEKEQIDLRNLHIKFAKEIMSKLELLKTQNLKLWGKFIHLVEEGKNFPAMKIMMERYKIFISEIFPITISSIEGGIILFPNKRSIIDYVIFDEASQIFLERGITLMNRGQKVVVAGDGKQLQPSNFFGKNIDNNDEFEDNDEDFEDFKASEYSSLLDFATTFFSKEMLNYHYRSDSRELIEFSNKIFYDGKLIVCEKPDKRQKAIEVRNVNGIWQKQVNEIEANVVVQEILNILRNRKNNETIGVVAFNKNQANLILEKLYKTNDPLVESEMNGNSDVDKCLFVKNLEEVQGDERDIIIFSVAFAKDPVTKRLNRNFGPINKLYGENRINVAVSRARKKIIVVKSISAIDFGHDISNLKKGASVFADYINYVDYLQNYELDNSNFQNIWSKYLVDYDNSAYYEQMESILEQEVYDKLNAYIDKSRFEIIPQVKQSGFRIDLAIKDKSSDRFVLAIECDGHRYHSKPLDRARDIWRQSILESTGWHFERISSLQWWRSSQNAIVKRILDKLEKIGNI